MNTLFSSSDHQGPINSFDVLVKNDKFRSSIQPLLKDIGAHNNLSAQAKFFNNLFDVIRDFFSNFLSFVQPLALTPY